MQSRCHPDRREGPPFAFRRPRDTLLTLPPPQRQSICEEPNSSCDDRCNAPIIRRKRSALLFLQANQNYLCQRKNRSPQRDQRGPRWPRICFLRCPNTRNGRIRAYGRNRQSQNASVSRNSTVTARPLPFPRLVNHSLIAAASLAGFTAKPASSFPSPTGKVSSNSADPVKLRMQKLSSHSKGAARRSAPITISASNFRAYIIRKL